MIGSLRKAMKNKKGYSLLELALAIGIMSVMAISVTPLLTHVRKNAKIAKLHEIAQSVDSAVQNFRATWLNSYPYSQTITVNGIAVRQAQSSSDSKYIGLPDTAIDGLVKLLKFDSSMVYADYEDVNSNLETSNVKFRIVNDPACYVQYGFEKTEDDTWTYKITLNKDCH